VERGEIVRLDASSIPLPREEDLAFLRDELPKKLSRKNVSWYPTAGLTGIEDTALAARTARILEERNAAVCAALERLVPRFTKGWTVGTSSFRPFEEQGRGLKAHASNELVHVDAGAYGATHGGRILRFFTNVNTTADRVWATHGTFAELYQAYGAQAGLGALGSLEPGPLDRARSAVLRAFGRAGLKKANVLDGSPYDRAMRRFHNFMKDTPAFQQDAARARELRFPPMSSWMCFTDTVSHACRSGQYALVDTFIVPLESCRLQASAPYYVLTRPSSETRTGT
jgi:hypothetical protein